MVETNLAKKPKLKPALLKLQNERLEAEIERLSKELSDNNIKFNLVYAECEELKTKLNMLKQFIETI